MIEKSREKKTVMKRRKKIRAFRKWFCDKEKKEEVVNLMFLEAISLYSCNL